MSARGFPGACALALLLAASQVLAAQEKFAVIVGINDYMEYDDELGGDLQGAERDALIMRAVLIQRWGIPEENVRTLLSLEATKEAIHEAIAGWLAEETRPGDLAVFYFAGHGSQALDLDGDEPDGLDETLAPTDVGRLSTENDILDDELREWLSAVRADVVVILDSCHSGSATRGTGSMRPRVLDRELPPEAGVEPVALREQPDAESMADGSRTIIEIAAAAPNQSAMEGLFQTSDGRESMSGGAFTYHLVRQLWRAPPSATYDNLVTRVVSNLKADQFTQDPQIEGPTDRPLFSVAQAEAPGVVAEAGAVEILEVDGGTVILSGGEAQGTTVGSVYRTESGAVLEVVLISGDFSGATAVSGNPTAGEMASLLDVALPSPTLAVDVSYLPADFMAALGPALSGLEGVNLVGDGAADPDLYLRISEDTRSVEVLGRDGGVRRLIPRVGGDAAVGEQIAGALGKELAVRRLAALDNPAAPFTVELSLRGGRRVFEPEDSIDFSVRTQQPGFLTLVDLGMDGTVTVLHPLPWENLGRLRAGQSVALPGGGSAYTIGEETGLGLVLAIVTPSPLDIPMPPDMPAMSSADRDLASEIHDRLAAVAQGEGSALRWATSLIAYEVVPRQ